MEEASISPHRQHALASLEQSDLQSIDYLSHHIRVTHDSVLQNSPLGYTGLIHRTHHAITRFLTRAVDQSNQASGSPS